MAAWRAALNDNTASAPRSKGPNARSLGNQRRFLLQRILKALQPHMWESGFRTAIDPTRGVVGNSRPLRLWCPQDKDGKVISNRSWRIGGYVVHSVEGFTENGPITDSEMVIVTTHWESIPLEDLVRIKAWLDRHLPAKPLAMAA